MKNSYKTIELLKKIYGEEFEKYFHSVKIKDKTFIRIRSKDIEEKIISSLTKKGFEFRKSLSVPIAYEILKGEEIIAKTIEYALGFYYLQNLSSMMPVVALNPQPYEKILDLCAAPGSKTTAIAEAANFTGTIIANDYKMDRIKILAHSIERLNCFNIGITFSAGHLLTNHFANYFDKVLVDAPCSALGTFNRKSDESWYADSSIEKLAAEQYRLLLAGIEMAKPNGIIVYSTCSFSIEENEAIIEKALKKGNIEIEDINLPLTSDDGIIKVNDIIFDESIKKCKRILPWKSDAEGFFVAKLKKKDETPALNAKDKISEKKILIDYDEKLIKEIFKRIIDEFEINEQEFRQFRYLPRKGVVYAVNKDFEVIDEKLFNRIGIPFAKYDKSMRAILHSNAAMILSNKIKKNFFELGNEKDLQTYLNGGIIRTEENYKGAFAVKWKDYIVGVGLGIGDGIKSQFPKIKRSSEITVF